MQDFSPDQLESYRKKTRQHKMMDPTYPLVPIINFLSIPLVILPLFTSIRQRQNVGVMIYAAWVAIRCLTVGVNTIVWKDNYDIRIPVWCDISE